MHNLDPIFNPKRIALVGASPNPNSVSGKVLQNIISGGFRGVVYPINPTNEAVLGVQCYPSVKSLPKIPDLAVICTPAPQVPASVRECGESGVRGIIIISAGFKEIGESGKILENQIKEEASRFDGMRIIGPNCLGIIVPRQNLNVSFASMMPRSGNVAFISQSGALCTSVLDWAAEGKIGFSHFVSIGNTLDVDFGDLIDYFGADENTKSIVLYIESIINARRFMTAARAFARSKPIIAYKAGRFVESAKVAASHTGAMASEDAVYDAAFQRTGLARVYDIGDVFDCVELIGRNRIPLGPRLGIVTNAGGPGVMATDALIAMNGVLAELSPQTITELDENLPPAWSHRNPVDVLGDAPPKRFEKAVEIVLKDPNVDALLAILTPQAMTNPNNTAKAVAKLADTTRKPILAAWLGGLNMREGIKILAENGVAAYQTPEQAIRSFSTLVSYSRNLSALYETPKDLPLQLPLNREEIRQNFIRENFTDNRVLTEDISKSLLETYGITTVKPHPAVNVEEAAILASNIGYPIVLKILSPDITHKTDIGGVALNIENEKVLRAEYERMMEAVKSKMPTARIEGVTVQKMINNKDAIEMILGIKRDPVFGSILMVGLGGIAAECLNDRALGLPPLNERLARRMLESLKIWTLLNGFRGKPAMNIEKLIELLIRLSYLAMDYPELMELDINPLLVTPNEVVALDARAVIEPSLINTPIEPYSHLVLRPYPEKYVTKRTLKDGTEVTLRPIKPEDEPLWFEMLGSCSKESLYNRFRYFFHWASHEVAIRYCYIDYDREIAIVAETSENGRRRLIGVGRLIADPDHQSVEYAVLIIDAYQNRELGSILTDYCIEIAKHWKLKRIVAQTTSDNRPMLSVFQKRNFKFHFNPQDSTVEVELVLDY